MDGSDCYRRAHRLFVAALGSVGESARVLACPAWDVHDLVAHQVHQLRSANEGSFPIADALAALHDGDARVRQDAWIAAGVAARRAAPIDTLVAEWKALVVDASAAALTGLAPDVVVHLFDLLGAAESAEHRDDPIVVYALHFWAQRSTERRQLICLDTTSPDDRAVETDFTVRGTSFELLRAITGRRSREQAGTLQWEGAVDAETVARFPAYGWRERPLYE